MVSSLPSNLKERAQSILVKTGLLSRVEALRSLNASSANQLHGDGSNRQFLRIFHLGESVCILVIPASQGQEDLNEARSAWQIGNHLREHNIPLPELYGWDEETGILLFEDLGDVRLHDLIVTEENSTLHGESNLLTIYRQVIEQLFHMQCAGAVDFMGSWCWDSPRYDRKVMIKRESNYFLQAFWQGLLGKEIVPGVEEELEEVAGRAAEAEIGFFLHRDFQCRNIMIKDGGVRIIDYQGGRMGPLGYDLASLLIDPYAGLSKTVQSTLLDYYISLVGKHIKIDRMSFFSHYNFLAFQRNMQIVGAFSFLFKVRKKVFFADYIHPALLSLSCRLQGGEFSEYPIIRCLVKEAIGLLATQGKTL